MHWLHFHNQTYLQKYSQCSYKYQQVITIVTIESIYTYFWRRRLFTFWYLQSNYSPLSPLNMVEQTSSPFVNLFADLVIYLQRKMNLGWLHYVALCRVRIICWIRFDILILICSNSLFAKLIGIRPEYDLVMIRNLYKKPGVFVFLNQPKGSLCLKSKRSSGVREAGFQIKL